MASSKWRGGPICASPGSLPACAQQRSSWMPCSAGIASSARRCGNICTAGNSSRQHASSQADPASYGCKLARKLPERLEATAEVRIMGCAAKPIDKYLNEFVFRYNRRFSRHVSFETMLGLASHPSADELL